METRTVTKEMLVAEDGFLHVGDLTPNEWVEVTVRPLVDAPGLSRRGGWAKGKVVIHEDFDDPLPEMEPYM